MKTTSEEKYRKLLLYLSKLENLAIAFSGGVDSTFLLYAASQALGDKLLALTIRTSYMPDREIQEATEICEQLSISRGTFYNYLRYREVNIGAPR